jgi:hypothetical protein
MTEYAWNPLWTDPIDDINAAYVSAVRRMIVASINWMADHSGEVSPKWREPSAASLARRAGVPVGTSIVIAAAWEDVYRPRNPQARDWFRAISDACGKGESAPSAYMMSKAIGCGILFKRLGWDAFDRFMLENPSDTKKQ